MNFALNEELQMLRDMAKDFAQGRSFQLSAYACNGPQCGRSNRNCGSSRLFYHEVRGDLIGSAESED